MKNDKIFFKRCSIDWWGGYYIKVRNRWNLNLEARHIPESFKELYETDFGHQIIYHDDFDEWYCAKLKEQKYLN
ncbi:MAG: hypothetical protein GXO79_16545 [Chlorobi bacterium]|nr:hypothetical protein [Chlorobiota bacterium]